MLSYDDKRRDHQPKTVFDVDKEYQVEQEFFAHWCELRRANPDRARKILITLAGISARTHLGLDIVTEFLSGDSKYNSMSFAEIGKLKGRSKQSVHQAYKRAMAVIGSYDPKLKEIIEAYRIGVKE